MEEEKEKKRLEFNKQKKEKLEEFEKIKDEVKKNIEINELHSNYIITRKNIDKNNS